jgi:signal peptidase I
MFAVSGILRGMTFTEWDAGVVRVTERYLTWRKRRRMAKREKQKKKNPVVDWLDAILSAVVIVLLINQYLLQAYQIPSQSMVPTLLISDRIFVNKILYGPELVPGMLKLPGFRPPARGDVIIFESPEYIPIGPVKDILQRIIYMVTLSIIDIDKDEYGQPKHHFLIKRAIGMPGDRLRMREGNVELLTPGAANWKPESVLQKELGFTYPTVRSFAPEEYPPLKTAGITIAREAAGLPTTDSQKKETAKYFAISRDSGGNLGYQVTAINDTKYFEDWLARTQWELEPFNAGARATWEVLENGWYIGEGRLFPMGDNRDDSRDARYFGQVRMEKVLGKGAVRYWPLGRLGLVR